MDHSRTHAQAQPGKSFRRRAASATLMSIMGVVFAAFLVIGFALPVLPLHVHLGLGFGTFVVGLVAGSQFAAAILSRIWAGQHADANGPKSAVVVGLIIAVLAGLLYLLSFEFVGAPTLSVSILLLGRALLGIGESFIITGAQAWGLAIVGVQHSGKVLAWVGSAMFAAFAVGAPAGTILYAHCGFLALGGATMLLPLATLLFVATLRRVPSSPRVHGGFMRVLAAVWVPGVASALSSIGFGAITAFGALLFVTRGWVPWTAFTVFAMTFILTRAFLSHLADQFGGAKVALVCGLVEAMGLGLMWLSPWYVLGLAGAALTGFGYSLVYPGFGVEAVRSAPEQSRGLAMGAYTVFLDVALGFGTPALGLLASRAGLCSAFIASMMATLGAAGIAAVLLSTANSRRSRCAFACP
jgi:MFS family permease